MRTPEHPRQMCRSGVHGAALVARLLGVLALMGAAAPSVAAAAVAPSHVVLTDLGEDDPFFAAARKLQEHRSARLIRFAPGKIAESLGPLREVQPAFVAIVLRPEALDINLAYEVLELATEVDDDPFVDFAFGFITGATAADALALVERTIQAEAAPPAAKRRVFAFGPTSTPQVDKGNAFPWLTGWERRRIEHQPGGFPPAQRPELAAADVIRFWGHGAPDSVDGGLERADLDGLTLRARMVFAGPCFSAVTHRYFDVPKKSRTLEARTVAADRSLALAFLSKGALTYFGALQEDRCLGAGQEFEHALTTGGPAGMTIKHTHDRIVMAHAADSRLAFSRLKAGAPEPDEEGTAGLLRLAAARVLLGDPAFQPFAGHAEPALTTKLQPTASGLTIEVTIANPRIRSNFVNALREDLCKCEDDNDTLYVRVLLPDAVGPILGVNAAELPACLDSARHSPVEWREESWLGERFLHVQIDFRHDTLTRIAPDTTVRFKVETAKRQNVTEEPSTNHTNT